MLEYIQDLLIALFALGLSSFKGLDAPLQSIDNGVRGGQHFDNPLLCLVAPGLRGEDGIFLLLDTHQDSIDVIRNELVGMLLVRLMQILSLEFMKLSA